MKTLAIIAQKGGAGKTTVALNIAIASVLAKRQTVLIDIDKQDRGDDRHRFDRATCRSFGSI